MMKNNLLVTSLKQKGLSITKPRILLFTILNEQSEPVTMNALIKLAAASLDRSTVYRTIDIFEKHGIVHRVYNGWKYKIELSDRYSNHHHHITCTSCGEITSFHDHESFEEELQNIARKQGYILDTHSLELRGTCANCQKKLQP